MATRCRLRRCWASRATSCATGWRVVARARIARAGASPAPTLLRIRSKQLLRSRVGAGLAPALVIVSPPGRILLHFGPVQHHRLRGVAGAYLYAAFRDDDQGVGVEQRG